MRILIAEDDNETAEFVRRGLSELGHMCCVTRDGPDALHLLRSRTSTLRSSIGCCPRLDGLSIVRRTRAGKVETPVLLLTALGRIEDRVEGLEAGADDYLVKPFAFSELAARVNALARRKPLQREPTELEHGGLDDGPAQAAGRARRRDRSRCSRASSGFSRS